MVRLLGWEGDQGGGFCQPRLKLNPVDLAKAGQSRLAVFFRCTSTIPLHFKVVRAQVDLKVAMTLGSSMAEIMAQLPQK